MYYNKDCISKKKKKNTDDQYCRTDTDQSSVAVDGSYSTYD